MIKNLMRHRDDVLMISCASSLTVSAKRVGAHLHESLEGGVRHAAPGRVERRRRVGEHDLDAHPRAGLAEQRLPPTEEVRAGRGRALRWVGAPPLVVGIGMKCGGD
jgi:hypothetical protein